MDIKDYVVASTMAIVWIVIQILKKPLFEKMGLNDAIPFFAALLGVLITVWAEGNITPMILLQGLASGFAATGINEGINAVFYKEDKE